MKFEDRSHEETGRQQRCAQSKPWDLAKKHSQASKKKTRAAFYFPVEEWVLPAASTKEPEERDFLWLIPGRVCIRSARKTFFSAELETMRTSRSPTTVMTANGEVQTREDATENVKELDSFVKVMLLEETPAVLSLGNICDEHGYTYHWKSGQNPHVIKNGKRTDCNKSNCVPFVVPGLSASSSSTTPTPTSSTSSLQDSVFDVSRYTENPVPERSGSTSA